MGDLTDAERAEFSEAAAYESLAQPAAPYAAAAGFPEVRRFGSALAVVAPAAATSFNLNRVIRLGVREPCDETTLDAVARLYSERNTPFAVELSPLADRARIAAWLRSRRMRRLPATALRIRALDRTAPLHADRRVRVQRASSEIDVERVAQTCCQVFRMPPAVHAMLAATRLDQRWRAWLAWHEGAPAGAALSFVDGPLAWLGWDATLPAYRGRGVQQALIDARLVDARESGCLHATSETAVHTASRRDPSGRNYEKMGFVLACERVTYAAMRAGERV